MSGASQGHPERPHDDEPDPSMDDILASIRRILSEDEAPQAVAAEPDPPVLLLDSTMMVQEPEPMSQTQTVSVTPAEPTSSAHPHAPSAPPLALNQGALVDEATQAAAASSVGNLIRTLTTARGTAIHRGGPTLEDMVRDEMRPLLKEWLDANLPTLVERLVQAEIERVIKASA